MGDVLGAIVAGGGSRRMGIDKALVEVGGVPMVERVAAAMGTVVPEIVIVGRAEPLAGLAAFPDDRPARRGPLAGLATALRVADGRDVLLVAVDQPLVRAETLRRLSPAAVPLDGGARQVTCAMYPGAWAAEAAVEDEAGGSIQSLLDRMSMREVPPEEWRSWGEDGRSWLSVDSPDDIARAERILAGR